MPLSQKERNTFGWYIMIKQKGSTLKQEKLEEGVLESYQSQSIVILK